jgi:ComF family protein
MIGSGKAILHEVFLSLTDFVFPPVCLLCNESCSGEKIICDICLSELKDHALSYSPFPRSLDYVNDICVLFPYDEACRTIVHAFKYHGMSSVAMMMGSMFGLKALNSLPDYRDAWLVPVPLHPEKFRQRGYNQSTLIARGFSSFVKHEIREDLLARKVFTGTQTALSQEERKKNVRGVFEFIGDKALLGERIILIDDVLTTGSTIVECARILAEAGVDKIAVCVIATPDITAD